MTAKCGNCNYWIDRDNGDGECHRNAPQPTVGEGDAEVHWPLTLASDWCGEFEEARFAPATEQPQ